MATVADNSCDIRGANAPVNNKISKIIMLFMLSNMDTLKYKNVLTP
jgi:hypothetical protein